MCAILAYNKKQNNIEPVPTGSFCARIYQMIHIGTITNYMGQLQNKIRIGFELPTEMMVFDKAKGEQPRVLSNDYTLSFHEKAKLTEVINACDPNALKISEDGFLEEFDVESLIGKECLITVIHKPSKDGKQVYANINGVTRLPKGMKCPEQINPTQILNYDDKWNEEIFNKLPEFIRNKMVGSAEYKKLKGLNTEDSESMLEDAPF